MKKNFLLSTVILTVGLTACSRSEKAGQQAAPEAQNAQPQQTSASTAGTSVRKKESSKEFLNRFYANPAQVMAETPLKLNAKGEVVTSSPFSAEEIASKDFIAKRNAVRLKLMGSSVANDKVAGRAAIANEEGQWVSDKVVNLVDNGNEAIQNLYTMEDKNLRQAALDEGPWSDDYWAIKNGILGHRYADSALPKDGNWKELFDFVKGNPVDNYVLNNQVDLLSPSEKYDLLIGDTSGNFTHSMWEEGRGYFERDGDVEYWMGICHGWAPAAYMLPRPVKPVTVKSFDGQSDIKFYPADIKALGSLLWARAESSSKFIGSRCNTKEPTKNAEGRVLEQNCFDNNPGTWHMAVVNQIGVSKRSFVLDATYDYEVWNQPVLSYSYNYFNPETGDSFETLDEAAIPMGSFSKDVFKSFRSSEATHIVGIEMNVKYIVENSPSQAETNSADEDLVTEAVYHYDLEIDGQGNIIGGEWYSSAHPDFLWTPPKGNKARSVYDRHVKGSWNPENGSIPSDWSRVGKAAAREGLPLKNIVEALFRQSSADPSKEL